MRVEHQDFIATYRDVFPEGFCAHLITEFERYAAQGAGVSRQQGEGALRHVKDDHQIFLNGKNLEFDPFNGERVIDVFFNGLQRCFDEYAQRYSVILSDALNTKTLKLQRTTEGGGYHIFHCEQGSGEHGSRALVFMLYLNSLSSDQCGETEFLYQHRRISPETGMMVLWPAAFTHAHRGNPVYRGGEKYIATGWFKYD